MAAFQDSLAIIPDSNKNFSLITKRKIPLKPFAVHKISESFIVVVGDDLSISCINIESTETDLSHIEWYQNLIISLFKINFIANFSLTFHLLISQG